VERFEKIKNDQRIIELYKKIAEFEELNKGMAHHHLEHVNNVANLVEAVLSKLNYDENFIEEAKIAALLHDTGAIEGKKDHALRSYQFAKVYLEEQKINLKNKDLVLEAIKIHSDGFQSDNIMALTLILCDKLDIKWTRLAKAGYHEIGVRQLQYIKDITVEIQNSQLEINFLCDNSLNKTELEEVYFILKAFKGIRAFSKKMNLQPKVLLNNEEWELFENH